MKPEEEAKLLQEQVRAAAASGNISAILSLITDSGSLTEDDYVEKSIGVLRAIYYSYLSEYHVRPKDLIDMVDGILYNDCKVYITDKEIARMKAKAEQERK